MMVRPLIRAAQPSALPTGPDNGRSKASSSRRDRMTASAQRRPCSSVPIQLCRTLVLSSLSASLSSAGQRAERRIRSGPCFCPQSHYVIILVISRQCPVVANVQMPLTVNTVNAHHHERELLHTRCLCTPTVAYAVPSRKRLRTSVGLSRFPDGARAGFIGYSLAPLNCWPDDSAGNTRPRGRRTARG
jgi:hypothetical protein